MANFTVAPARSVPLMVTCVPTGPDVGLMLVMVGPVTVMLSVVVTLVTALPTVLATTTVTVNVPAALYLCVGAVTVPEGPVTFTVAACVGLPSPQLTVAE